MERRRLRTDTSRQPSAAPPAGRRKDQEKPFRASRGWANHANRRGLLTFLTTEFTQGNTLSKLYVTLLARTVIAQDPKLVRDCRAELVELGLAQELADADAGKGNTSG